MEERWRSIPGYEGLYEVSDRGGVRSLDRVSTDSIGRQRRWPGKRLSLLRAVAGNYRSVSLSSAGQVSRCYVHRLVWEAFVGPIEDGNDICHNNGDPTDNRLSNLRSDTRLGNNADKVRHGTLPIGSAHHAAKLSEGDIPVIRRRCEAGEPYRGIARDYSVLPTTIRQVHNRKTWRHVA